MMTVAATGLTRQDERRADGKRSVCGRRRGRGRKGQGVRQGRLLRYRCLENECYFVKSNAIFEKINILFWKINAIFFYQRAGDCQYVLWSAVCHRVLITIN